MAAKNTNVDLTANTWTMISEDADVTTATFQNLGPSDIRVMGVAGAVTPTDTDDGVVYGVHQGEASRALVELFPGITPTRLYAKSLTGLSKVFISHA